jgi:hypothetical protein
MPRKKGAKAQNARSTRYEIAVREDGNAEKPDNMAELHDSQWGDPVNYLYSVPDKSAARAAKAAFGTDEEYDGRSRQIVRGRLNRLMRKYKVAPIKMSAPGEPELGNYLIGEIQLSDEDLEPEDEHFGMLRIPAARSTVLEHPWWGPIHLDEDLFESFIDNWETNLVGFDLAIDPSHDPHEGALAWVKDVTLSEDGQFDLWVEPTNAGIGVLGDVFRYASIEYTTDYTDAETGASYGPTLLGCAATNRPFVHRQDAIQVLSADVMRHSDEVPENASYIVLANPIRVEDNEMAKGQEDHTPVADLDLTKWQKDKRTTRRLLIWT